MRRTALYSICLVLLAATTVVGCDFARIDEGADTPLETLLHRLTDARSEASAEAAIRQIFAKAEVGADWKMSPQIGLYDGYTFEDADIAAMARAHAAFNRGELGRGKRIADVFTEIASVEEDIKHLRAVRNLRVARDADKPIQAGLDETLTVFRSYVQAALGAPDHPTNALLLAIVADGTALPADVPAINGDVLLSPAQQVLFAMWLHKHAPFIYPFQTQPVALNKGGNGSGGGNNPCCGADPAKFFSITLVYLGNQTNANIDVDIVVPSSHGVNDVYTGTLNPNDVFTVIGPARNNSGFNYTLGNEIALNVNGQFNAQIHTSCSVAVLPGDVYGDFLVISVVTKNGGICSTTGNCTSNCVQQYVACMQAGNGKSVCDAQYSACNEACHDQGSGN